jgi:Lon protease-like protein
MSNACSEAGSILQIAIFPHPDVVFFPKTQLRLQVVESRHRQLVADALEGDHLVGIVLLKPGWEILYHEPPETHMVGCLGRIEQVETLEDGGYHIVLLGTQKFRILRLIRSIPYRIAEVELTKEIPVDDSDLPLQRDKAELLRLMKLLADKPAQPVLAYALVNAEALSYETLVNQLAMAINIELLLKQQLLELDEIRCRGQAMLQLLQSQLEALNFCDRFRHLATSDPSLN